MAEVEETHWWYVSTRALLARLLRSRLPDESSLPGGPRFLDAGCGTGATGAWLAEHGSIVALDVAPQALAIYDELHPGAALVEGGVEQIDLPDNSVDGALSVTVL